MGLSFNKKYIASGLCNIMYKNRDVIFSIWEEESDTITQRRYELLKDFVNLYNPVKI